LHAIIKPQQVRSYALAKGWQRMPGVNGNIALFNHPQGHWDQLIVPMDESFDDYAKRLGDVVENLAKFESRPVAEVLDDLITPEADILRYRVASQATGRGSIPLLEGVRLLDGARRSLLAEACSVLSPMTHHPRMSRAEAQQLLSACSLGQTERGSYAVSDSCPLRAVEQDQTLLPGSEPFARKTVSTLMRSMSRIIHAIEADTVPNVFLESQEEPVLSANPGNPQRAHSETRHGQSHRGFSTCAARHVQRGDASAVKLDQAHLGRNETECHGLISPVAFGIKEPDIEG
jgi:hypothetical protein